MAISACARLRRQRQRRGPRTPRPWPAGVSSASSSRRFSTNTWQRESSAPFSSKDGFSVVAPTRVTIALLDERQEAVLLGAVEAVDLVDEQQGRLAGGAAAAGRLERLLQVGDAGEHRRQLLELVAGLLGQQAGDGGLAGAGRPPEDHRGQPVRARPCAGSGRPGPAGGPGRPPRRASCGRSRSASGRGASGVRPAASKRSVMAPAYLRTRRTHQAVARPPYPRTCTVISWPPRSIGDASRPGWRRQRRGQAGDRRDRLAVDLADEVAGLQAEAGRVAAGDAGHHHADAGERIEAQLVGGGRRQVDHRRAVERIAAARSCARPSAGVSGGASSRDAERALGARPPCAPTRLTVAPGAMGGDARS